MSLLYKWTGCELKQAEAILRLNLHLCLLLIFFISQILCLSQIILWAINISGCSCTIVFPDIYFTVCTLYALKMSIRYWVYALNIRVEYLTINYIFTLLVSLFPVTSTVIVFFTLPLYFTHSLSRSFIRFLTLILIISHFRCHCHPLSFALIHSHSLAIAHPHSNSMELPDQLFTRSQLFFLQGPKALF